MELSIFDRFQQPFVNAHVMYEKNVVIGYKCTVTKPLSVIIFFFSSRRRHTRFDCDWSSDVCSSDLIAAKAFAEQMRYLKANHYRVITLAELHEFLQLKRQLPRRAVVLTFDDGYRSFLTYAYPVLKELGFTATLFVYTDYVGTGRNALAWEDLARLAGEGFEVEAHSKSHGDLRRAPAETGEQYARRMQAELRDPIASFQRQLGLTPRILAYPYGGYDAA